ncbi:cupin-like domain-containing protein [Hysterangium stoloniferum]|nr:cupin-like domain-containing protein [Hysterangium stoloniferum]
MPAPDKNPSLIAKEYRELNGNSIQQLPSSPTALEFLRLVHISRPVLIKDHWTRDYLVQCMGPQEISVAVTPQGQGPDGCTYFAEPCVEKMTMNAFLDRLTDRPEPDQDREIVYLQSQNGNLYPSEPSEFELLLPEVPRDISWATEALGRSPDAVNLWIGDGRSVTSVHSDPYENLYTVVRGIKHFTLFPPTEAHYLQEKTYKHALYHRHNPSSPLAPSPSSSNARIRWSSIIDPSIPGSVPGALPIKVDVCAGETLYLPPGWWHHVRQSTDHTGTCIALNWWYDMEMRGMHWVWLQYLRGTLGANEDEEGNK